MLSIYNSDENKNIPMLIYPLNCVSFIKLSKTSIYFCESAIQHKSIIFTNNYLSLNKVSFSLTNYKIEQKKLSCNLQRASISIFYFIFIFVTVTIL